MKALRHRDRVSGQWLVLETGGQCRLLAVVRALRYAGDMRALVIVEQAEPEPDPAA